MCSRQRLTSSAASTSYTSPPRLTQQDHDNAIDRRTSLRGSLAGATLLAASAGSIAVDDHDVCYDSLGSESDTASRSKVHPTDSNRIHHLLQQPRSKYSSIRSSYWSRTDFGVGNHYTKNYFVPSICEPPSKTPGDSQQQRSWYHSFYNSYYKDDKGNKEKEYKSHEGKNDYDSKSAETPQEASKSESFFDMAQQWASGNLPTPTSNSSSENTDHSKKVDNADMDNDSNSEKGAKSNGRLAKEESTIGPEAFLRQFGLLKGVIGPVSSSEKGETNRDISQHEEKQKKQQKEQQQRDDTSNELDGAMKDSLESFLNRIRNSGEVPSISSLVEKLPTSSSSDESQPDRSDSDANYSNNRDGNMFENFFSFAKNIKANSFFSSSTSKKESSPPDITEIIQQAQSIASQLSSYSSSPSTSSQQSSSPSLEDSLSSSPGFLSQVLYFQRNARAIQNAFESSFGPLLSKLPDNKSEIFQSLSPTTLHYYLEEQDSVKSPSWKRRMHRFQPSVEVERVEELNEALILSELSYADSVEEVREGLNALYRDGSSSSSSFSLSNSSRPHWELLFCDTQSRPNQPSHFLAIQKNSSKYDDALHILMVVRGTKSMSDLITDAMMEATDYEIPVPGNDNNGSSIRGKAHSGMIQSGQYLVQRHKKLLSTLLKLSNKQKIEVTLIGHSLGAGAATIAAMEWNSKAYLRRQRQQKNDDSSSTRDNTNDDDVEAYNIPISAHVVGFGCPALLSEQLSRSTRDYVTTVIADADFIPRMSGATLVNLLLDLRKLDYRKQAERDVEQALRELQTRFTGYSSSSSDNGSEKNSLPFNIDDDDIKKVMNFVHSGLEKVIPSSTPSPSAFPPGQEQNEIDEGSNTDGGRKENWEERMKPVLFPPGTCIHFYRDGSGIDGTYVPCTFFNEIDVARTMVNDHLISSGYRRIFLNLMRDFHRDDHFSFESNKMNDSTSK